MKGSIVFIHHSRFTIGGKSFGTRGVFLTRVCRYALLENWGDHVCRLILR